MEHIDYTLEPHKLRFTIKNVFIPQTAGFIINSKYNANRNIKRSN